MSLKEDIIVELKNGPMSDRELADKLLGMGKPQQSINQTCRQLAEKGIIMRTTPPIKNILRGSEKIPAAPQKDKTENASSLSEEAIKEVLNNYLIKEGWKTEVAWGNAHGIDIDAFRNGERWIIEVKGSGSLDAMRVNYFISILGETLQRMNDPNARYSIALPDLQQFKNLWARLPVLAKHRTTIDAIFVSENGKIDFIE